MKNFRRVLRLALQHRLNIIGCVVSALAVAVLWAANLSAVFPVVDVIMTDRALPAWIDDQLADHESKAALLQENSNELHLQLSDVPEGSEESLRLNAELKENRYRHDIHAESARRYRWAAPYAHKYLPSSTYETLLLVIVFVLVGTVLRCLFRIVNVLLVARLGCTVSLRLRKEFHRKLLSLEMKNFNQQGRGDLMNRCTTDLDNVYSGVRTVFGESLLEPLKMVACFAVAASVSWRLLIIALLIVPIAGYAVRRLAKSLKRAHRRTMQELSSIFETLTETMSAIKLIKAFTMESVEQERFHKTAKQYYHRQMRTSQYSSLVSPLTELFGVSMILLTAMAGGYLVLNRQTHILGIKISDVPLTHGLMSVFFAMMAGMSDPGRRLSALLNRLQQAAAAADRVYKILDCQPEITDPIHPQPLPKLKVALQFENVNFHYSPDKPVLRGVNLTVEAGKTFAILGLNGCGKSTLLNLVLRFYDPTSGAITIDGVDLRDVKLHDLRRRIGLVSQETLLLNETVAFNISYGTPDATQDAIEAAARQAHAYKFITEKLHNGFQTIVGPGGNRLSGGQRQRIALARAILRDPEILILDEATSQIDLESEQLIHQVLQDFMRDRTALVVTHRLNTIALADRIVVMNDGRIASVGTHDELIKCCELYQKLANFAYGKSA